LRSEKTGRFYVGSTANLTDRLLRHNSGRSLSTKGGIPWTLCYEEEYATRSEAVVRELEIKKWKSSKMIEDLSGRASR
jgi:putative endonuclease